ncbi:MAG: TatD family hydrolase [Candidatus Nanopusillus sp.]|jgi:TatD DNase family protein|nr:TatD family hydrolase [Candidatus Nanopusillus sp.]
MIVDDHAHLFLYENVDEKIRENVERNVKYIIENSIDVESINIVIEESRKYDIIYYALGLYPEEIVKMNDDDIEKILEFIEENEDKKFLAIGEVGLDFSSVDEDKIRKQKIYFEKFLELADRLKKPVIIHSRKAEKDVLDILTSYNNKRVLHTFWKPSLVDKAIEINCYLSIPTIVYRDPGFQKIVEDVPLELILTETDSPYLDPIEKGKAVNNSWKIIYSLEKISEIKDIDKKELEEIIFNNFVKVYNINNDE